MKKYLFLVVALLPFAFSPSPLSAFNFDLALRLGVMKVQHPDYTETKWGFGADGAVSMGITHLVGAELRTGYWDVKVKNPEINISSGKISLHFLKLYPTVASIKIHPLYFIPIIDPYVILGLGMWKIKEENKSSYNGFGGDGGVGVSVKGGCFGFDIRFLMERPDFKSSFTDYKITLAPVLYLGF